MKIAVTYDNGQIFQHFGHTENFKIFNIENNEVISSYIVNTNGNGHGALSGFLNEENVDILICGGIGMGAQNALTSVGIKFFGGVSGDADKAVENYLSGNLDFNPNVKCNHHEHEHNNHSDCGNHGCGGNCH